MIEELYKKFMDIKFVEGLNYPISRGSVNWSDLKNDYKLRNMDVAGAVSFWRSKSLDKINLNEWNEELRLFQTRVLNYEPKIETEKQEKEIISERIKIGLNIYEELMKIKEEKN